jgi:osmotically-inducible protein OsmY
VFCSARALELQGIGPCLNRIGGKQLTVKRPAGSNANGLHPEHESWVRISTHNSAVGLAIFLAVFALFVVLIALRLGPSSFAAAGIPAALALLCLSWIGARRRRSGLLENAWLTARIKADLITELGASDVNVDSSNGVVTLRGSVSFPDFRDAAEELARQQGATKVVDELNVVAPAPGQYDAFLTGLTGVTAPAGAPEVPTHAPLDEMVREALESDPRVNENVMSVDVEDGIAYLTGRQETVQASGAAAGVAAHVPGVLGVSNDVEIMPSV